MAKAQYKRIVGPCAADIRKTPSFMKGPDLPDATRRVSPAVYTQTKHTVFALKCCLAFRRPHPASNAILINVFSSTHDESDIVTCGQKRLQFSEDIWVKLVIIMQK
jgi:hypothetical protein